MRQSNMGSCAKFTTSEMYLASSCLVASQHSVHNNGKSDFSFPLLCESCAVFDNIHSLPNTMSRCEKLGQLQS